jgi:hypothetical protein
VFGDEDAGYDYTLAGSSCLASDVFGDYAFGKPLKCGEQVVMQNVGAYSHVKCHSFNGLNIPTIYMVDENQNFSEVVSFDYSDFARKNGVGAADDSGLVPKIGNGAGDDSGLVPKIGNGAGDESDFAPKIGIGAVA